jgi:TRAP-type mannitol/chloroaromatic compound transport system permease small subunit
MYDPLEQRQLYTPRYPEWQRCRRREKLLARFFGSVGFMMFVLSVVVYVRWEVLG